MIQTEKRICSALRELLQTFPYDSVSIQGICTKADVSRKSFSKYFTSIQDVVIEQMRVDFIKPAIALRSLLPVNEMENATHMMLKKVFDTFFQQRWYYEAVIEGAGKQWFMDAFISLSKELNEEIYANMGVSPEDLSFIAYIFGAVSAGTLDWWRSVDYAKTSEQMATMLEVWMYAHWREIQNETELWRTADWQVLRDSGKQ